jgi:hypothetical protein
VGHLFIQGGIFIYDRLIKGTKSRTGPAEIILGVPYRGMVPFRIKSGKILQAEQFEVQSLYILEA